MIEAPENLQNRPFNRPFTDASGGSRLIRALAVLLAVIILSAFVISACSSSSAGTTSTTRAATTAAGGPWATTTAPGFDKGGAGQEGSPILPTGTAQPTSGTRPGEVPVKIIRNASLELETENVEKTYQELLAFATARGGYEASRRLTTNDDNAYIEARIKIAPQYLDEFLGHAGNMATVLNVQTTSQDVTESYYDVQTRLRTMEQMLAKYSDFLTRANTVSEALSVQSEINRLTTEIESLKGRLRYYDSMVAESTVTLVIRKIKDPIRTTREVRWNSLTLDDMWYLMRSGLVTVANTITNILQWLVIAIVALSPLLIIALIAWLVIRKRRGSRPPDGTRGGRHSRVGGSSQASRWNRDRQGRPDDRPGDWLRQESANGPSREEPLIPAPPEEPLIPPEAESPVPPTEEAPPPDEAAAPPPDQKAPPPPDQEAAPLIERLEATPPPDQEAAPSDRKKAAPDGPPPGAHGIVAPGFADWANAEEPIAEEPMADEPAQDSRQEDDPRKPSTPEIPERPIPEEIPPRNDRPEIPAQPEIPEIQPDKPDRIDPKEPTPEIPDRKEPTPEIPDRKEPTPEIPDRKT